MITLRLRAEPPTRVELDGVIPEALAGQSALTLARRPLALGRELSALGDWFDITGRVDDEMRIEGPLGRVDRIGAGMTGGRLRVIGDAGAYVGLGMTGGDILVEGSVDLGCAMAMGGGAISVTGGAGERLGGALPGALVGMSGGRVDVAGDVGARAGERMRRGLIVVDGNAGDLVGAHMRAGTIVVMGRCGLHPGRGMRRGTILALAGAASLSVGFGDCGMPDLIAIRLMEREAGRVFPTNQRRFAGDLTLEGRGELFLGAD